MQIKKMFIHIYIAIASCVIFSFSNELPGEAATTPNGAYAKGKFMRRDRGRHGEHGHRGHRGHRGHHGHRGVQGRQGTQGIAGPQGLQGNQGEEGERGVPGNMALCSSWSFDTGSDETFDLYACSLQNSPPGKTLDQVQFLQPAPLFKGFVPEGAPVIFTPFVQGSYPQYPVTSEGKFTIQTGGAGRYLIHYGLVGVPNGIYNTDFPGGFLLMGDFLNLETTQHGASCWICVKVTHANGVANFLGAIPLSFTRTLNAQNIPESQQEAPHTFSSYVVAGFGQVATYLLPGDEVTVMIMLGSSNQVSTNVPLQINGLGGHDFNPDAATNRILHINANNTIYRWLTPAPQTAINLSRGATLSIERMGA
jgi:hypothetical protein